jgi:hypothetical protein
VNKKTLKQMKQAAYEVRKDAVKKHGASEQLPKGKIFADKRQKALSKRKKDWSHED